MRYRKISVQIWNDETVLGLSERAEGVFFYLLTHPNLTQLGTLRATPEGLASERAYKVTPKDFKDAFQELVDTGLVCVAGRLPLIILPNFIKHNLPQNPNQVKHMVRSLELVPVCDALREQIERAKQVLDNQVKKELSELFVELLPEPFNKPLAKPLSKPLSKPSGKGFAKQETEAVTETKAEAEDPPPVSPPSPKGETEDTPKPKRKPRKKTTRPAGELEIPPELNTPAFLEAWGKWQEHRKEIKKGLTASTAGQQLAKLAEEGAACAVYRITRSIRNGWQGLWFPGDEDPEIERLMQLKRRDAPAAQKPMKEKLAAIEARERATEGKGTKTDGRVQKGERGNERAA